MLKVFLKFGLVGALNSVIDYGLFQLFVHFFVTNGNPVGIIIANTVSSGIAVINSFFWNKKWTFQDKNDKYIRQFIIFLVVNAFSIAVNDGMVLLLNHILPVSLSIFSKHIASIYFTKIGAIAVTMIFNFIAYRLFVFELKVHSQETEDADLLKYTP